MKSNRPYWYPVLNAKYDFEAFVQGVKSLDYYEIMSKANGACAAAERASYEVRGAPAARAAGSVQFAERLKALLFFLGQGAIPAGSSASDLRLYKEIAENLVQKKQLIPDVLDLFKGVS